MNSVRRQMQEEGKLDFPKLTVLDTTYYKSAMLYDWTVAYTNPKAAAEVNQEGVTVHYTMLFNDTKILAARQFGQWLDEEYYTSPPRILQPVGIEGNSMDIRLQLALAPHLSNVTGRHFMIPNYVRHKCPHYHGGYKLIPPIMVADFCSIEAAVPGWVEGMYLQNRERYTSTLLSTESVGVDRYLGAYGVSELFELCGSSRTELLNVDFTGFDVRKLGEIEELGNIVNQTGVLHCTDCEIMAKWSAIGNYTIC